MAHICAFCKDPIPAYDKPKVGHLVVAKTQDGHIHTHGDLEKQDVMAELLQAAGGHVNHGPAPVEPPKEIIFHNRQRIGDMFMFTCGVRDFKKAFPTTRVNVMSTCAHIWDHNPAIDRTLEPYYSEALKDRAAKNGKKVLEEITAADFPKETNVVKIGPGRLTNASNRLDWHFANGYRVSIEDALKISIPQGESRPDIWLTEEEYNAPRPFPFPYWVICVSGEKGWGCKMYPFESWQKVVDQNPDLMFVQIGAKGDNPPRLQGPNVIDHVGKTEDKNTGIRDLLKLFLNAEGSIGLVSFHMHLSGGLNKPSVVVAGAREPVSFTRYAGHQYLANDGTLPCAVTACWHCDIRTCTNLVNSKGDSVIVKKDDVLLPVDLMPKCVHMIEPEDITRAIRNYYIGGRLILGQPSEKPKHKNIVKTPAPVAASDPAPVVPAKKLDWGKGAIDPKDWPFIEEVLKKHQIKTVLEFGAGLSTSLFVKAGVTLTSFETEQEWINKVNDACGVDVKHWNGRDMNFALDVEYDLAFVDGPANGQNREHAMRIAANYAKIVIVHDATREWETKWEEKYLKAGFQGPFKGGKWCHLWIKTPSFVWHPEPPKVQVSPKAKTVKIVSTARGWGGAQRSVTTIMKMLLARGHKVEFLPFHKEVKSREFQDALKNGLMDVKVQTDYSSLQEPCDVLLCYADDFVWEFGRIDVMSAFRDLKAKRKIMMLNYRRGGVGELEWTKGWDKYLFLNSGQEKELLRYLPGVETGVLAPCTNLEPFFEAKVSYDNPLRIVRHNSQGDTKFVKDGGAQIHAALGERKDLEIHMMPGPSFMSPIPGRFTKYSRNFPPVYKFLELGNLFWYSVPEGYMDMGPRVIMEAMAAGLPILADNWGGAADRVTPETGWLCSKEEQLEIIKNVTKEELEEKGTAARARAFNEFRPQKWMEELLLETVNA